MDNENTTNTDGQEYDGFDYNLRAEDRAKARRTSWLSGRKVYTIADLRRGAQERNAKLCFVDYHDGEPARAYYIFPGTNRDRSTNALPALEALATGEMEPRKISFDRPGGHLKSFTMIPDVV